MFFIILFYLFYFFFDKISYDNNKLWDITIIKTSKFIQISIISLFRNKIEINILMYIFIKSHTIQKLNQIAIY